LLGNCHEKEKRKEGNYRLDIGELNESASTCIVVKEVGIDGGDGSRFNQSNASLANESNGRLELTRRQDDSFSYHRLTTLNIHRLQGLRLILLHYSMDVLLGGLKG